MIDAQPYLESIGTKYAQWWECYIITDVVGKKHNARGKPLLLLDLKAFYLPDSSEAIGLPPDKQQPREPEETKEVLNVLEGLQKDETLKNLWLFHNLSVTSLIISVANSGEFATIGG